MSVSTREANLLALDGLSAEEREAFLRKLEADEARGFEADTLPDGSFPIRAGQTDSARVRQLSNTI